MGSSPHTHLIPSERTERWIFSADILALLHQVGLSAKMF
jgi:hypothetical protein